MQRDRRWPADKTRLWTSQEIASRLPACLSARLGRAQGKVADGRRTVRDAMATRRDGDRSLRCAKPRRPTAASPSFSRVKQPRRDNEQQTTPCMSCEKPDATPVTGWSDAPGSPTGSLRLCVIGRVRRPRVERPFKRTVLDLDRHLSARSHESTLK
uniref:Uncharacterized protein n=1 Tax=Plectus sambesii TaxID=2011161 RepID=A0A914WF32_9BILA